MVNAFKKLRYPFITCFKIGIEVGRRVSISRVSIFEISDELWLPD